MEVAAVQIPQRLHGARRVLFIAVAILLMAVAVLGVQGGISPAPANAHSSSYCGHGTSGSWDVTIYQGYYNDPYYPWVHWHLYWHDMRFGTDHYQWTACGYW